MTKQFVPAHPIPRDEWTQDLVVRDAGALWIDSLRAFAHLERRRGVTRRLRAACYGSALALAFILMFLTKASPHATEFLAQLVLIALPVMLMAAPAAGRANRRTEEERNRLARRFFDAGLRPEGHDLLVTNVAHPRIVLDLRSQAA